MADTAPLASVPAPAVARALPASMTGDLGVALLVAAAYYAGSLTGFLFRFPSSGIAYIWPPNALLLAALLLVRPAAWPLILAATFAAHGVAHTQNTLPVQTWVWQFMGNAVQAVIGAGIVARFCERPFRLDRLRDIAIFLGGAAFAAPALGSLVPASAYVTMGWASDVWSAWALRTLTNVVTTMTLVPPLVMILGQGRELVKDIKLGRVAEFLVLLTALLAIDLVGPLIPLPSTAGLSPALFACMPFLAWASIRFGAAGLSICVLVLVYLTVGAPDRALWLREAPSTGTLVGIQLFVSICVAPLMLLSGALAESRRARQAEEVLHHTEVKTSAILSALPDLMFVQSSGPAYRYLDFHARNPDDLLAPPESFLGKPMREVLPLDLAQPFAALFEQTIARGGPQVLEYSVPVHGQQRSFEARAVRCEDGRLVTIVREITERKRAEDGLRHAQQELAQMSRVSALGQLAASIAHEVHQPLTAISVNAAAGSSSLDLEPPDVALVRAALADIVDDSRRASQVITRTRDLFAGIRHGSEAVELTAAIDEVILLTRTAADRIGAAVQVHLAPAPLRVMGDRVQLQQVLMNLIRNGIDAMHALPERGGVLRVEAWSEARQVHVTVRDSGPGFNLQDSDRIFDPFYTTKPGGLGMGLAISRSIVHAHGGTLEASVNTDTGATFELVLPEAAI